MRFFDQLTPIYLHIEVFGSKERRKEEMKGDREGRNRVWDHHAKQAT